MLFLRRFYNQNRKTIWITIAIIIFTIIIIQALNYIVKNNQNKSINSTSSLNTTSTTNYDPNYSVITGDKIEETTNKETTNIIDNFIKYCNEGNTEKAYNLLTDDCKSELFPTLEIFVNNYYKKIFTNYKTYNIQAWIISDSSYTYKIRILDDILSTRTRKHKRF